MKNLLLLSIVVALSACASTPSEPPTGEYRWNYTGSDLASRTRDSLMSDLHTQSNVCRLEALKIPTASPACAGGISAMNSCEGMVGFAKGFCESQRREKISMACDYTATTASQGAQSETYRICMEMRHWEQRWHEFTPDEYDARYGVKGVKKK